jgi:hypothetical protein
MANRNILLALVLLAIAASVGIAIDGERLTSASGSPQRSFVPTAATRPLQKPMLGATALIVEVESGLRFAARVDTGANSCSIHVENLTVIGRSPRMQENVGKPVRFRITNRAGQLAWLERPINEVSLIKNSNCAEWRYKVPMTFRCEGRERQVLVSLNDRSDMNYPLLVGRNYLAGAFLVDVGADE